MTIDPYLSKKTGILDNKLGISDGKQLQYAERNLTACNVAKIRMKKYESFSLKTMQEIHKELFKEVYEWAGKVRTVDIAKSGTVFCRSEFIEPEADRIFSNLEKDNYLKGLDQEKFCEKAAELFCDVNMLHPFREGNGRTQRELIYHIAKNAGYNLDLTKGSKEKYMFASIVGQSNSKQMAAYMKGLVEPIKDKKKAAKRNLSINVPAKGKEKGHIR